ncbi:MAG: hydroxymethylglutaryl-CoA reductase [Thiotrichales bacterium]|jgi:hydroxymethylglutaryl-CoA reductase (NADPH)|nr:hydroxymethylglutaryl-CoA reductase [Thiotrichales bacterium]
MTHSFAAIPMQTIGPMKLIGDINDEVVVPLATYETPLWPSVNRGARTCSAAGGIRVTLLDEHMSRSFAVQAANAQAARAIAQALAQRLEEASLVVASTSRFARLKALNTRIVGRILYIRLDIHSGDASGHNMVTQSAEHLQNWVLSQWPELNYVSISANYCTDKKVSAVNSIEGRGKSVIAECTLPEKLVARYLKTTPQRLVDLHIRKNLIGSILAGSLMSANAHAANMLLAFFLATGQDAANIVEGSQAIDHAEVLEDGSLYFSVSLPNLIVGTIGNGKGLEFVTDNLALMGCSPSADAGSSARRLAMICAATVLCGELSLLAAQTNPGELMQSHRKLERHQPA